MRISDWSSDVCSSDLERQTLGPRMALVGNPDLQALGEALHRFLAADDQGRSRDERLTLAADLLVQWGVPQLQAPDLVNVSDRLHAFLAIGRASCRERVCQYV